MWIPDMNRPDWLVPVWTKHSLGFEGLALYFIFFTLHVPVFRLRSGLDTTDEMQIFPQGQLGWQRISQIDTRSITADQ